MPETEITDSVGLAKILNVTPETIRKWRVAGILPAIVINPTTIRYDVNEVLTALKNRSAMVESDAQLRTTN